MFETIHIPLRYEQVDNSKGLLARTLAHQQALVSLVRHNVYFEQQMPHTFSRRISTKDGMLLIRGDILARLPALEVLRLRE